MKTARTVLRGRGGGNAVLLPDITTDAEYDTLIAVIPQRWLMEQA